MVTAANNESLTRVEGAAPLGGLLRANYWIPCARSEGLKSGDKPQRVRLLGQNFVAFRGNNGQPGLVDEHCPHRRASLALARVEGCALRCIYHGWLVDGSGAVVEVPSEGKRSAEFAAHVGVNRYQVREAGGLVWAFLGTGTPPELPPLPFLQVPAQSRWWSRMLVKCNWLQGFEGALDSVHLTWLHQGWPRNDQMFKVEQGLSYEVDETSYGLRTAAIRTDETEMHLRVAEYVAPFYAFSASRQPFVPTDCSVFISVPVDDETHMLFFGFFDAVGPLHDVSTYFSSDLDPDDLITGTFEADNCWGQDREAMAQGHFSGLTKSVLHEDVAVQMSMGPIVDRSAENLCSTDLAIVKMRNYLLDLIERHEDGQAIDGAMSGYRKDGKLPLGCSVPVGTDWRKITTLKTGGG